MNNRIGDSVLDNTTNEWYDISTNEANIGLLAYLDVDYIMNLSPDEVRRLLGSHRDGSELCADVYEHVASNLNISVDDVVACYQYHDNKKLEEIMMEDCRKYLTLT